MDVETLHALFLFLFYRKRGYEEFTHFMEKLIAQLILKEPPGEVPLAHLVA